MNDIIEACERIEQEYPWFGICEQRPICNCTGCADNFNRVVVTADRLARTLKAVLEYWRVHQQEMTKHDCSICRDMIDAGFAEARAAWEAKADE